MAEEGRTSLSHHSSRGIKTSSSPQTSNSRVQQNREITETFALVGPHASIKEDMGSAKEGPYITDTARTGVGTTIRKVRGMDRQTLRVIKEYPQEQPKTKRLRM